MRFFKSVLEEKFMNKYDKIKIYQYAQRSKKQLKSFIEALNKEQSRYIVLVDFDNSRCMTDKKQQFRTKKIGNVTDSKIFIAKSMIESWYLAGLDSKSSRSLMVIYHSNTDDITKEQFEQLMPDKYSSKIDFMVEILKKFDYDTAIKQNASFQYLNQKYSLSNVY